jgi:hypothetical protein
MRSEAKIQPREKNVQSQSSDNKIKTIINNIHFRKLNQENNENQ